MDDVTAKELASESVALANAIGELTAGRTRLAVFSAFGLLAGALAADAKAPDLEAVIADICRVAAAEFARRTSEKGAQRSWTL